MESLTAYRWYFGLPLTPLPLSAGRTAPPDHATPRAAIHLLLPVEEELHRTEDAEPAGLAT